MKYFELICDTLIKDNLHFKTTLHAIAKYINYSLRQDRYYLNRYGNDELKPYCFGGFYPIQKDKIYKQGDIHKFTIRTIDEKLANLLIESLKSNTNNKSFQVLEVKKISKNKFKVSEIYSATPVIVSSSLNKKGYPLYWTVQKDGDINRLQEKLNKSLIDKYNNFYESDLEYEYNFIEKIELKNRVPQNIYIQRYDKELTLFGNKFKIIPKDDDHSQKLAFLALSLGLGESTKHGGGFCLSR